MVFKLIYGSSSQFPLSETTKTDKPISLYAATKKSNELIAYSYSNIYNLKLWIKIFYCLWALWKT